MSTININNLRRQTAFSLDKVIKILNESIVDNGYSRKISVPVDKLEKPIAELQMLVASLLCIYEEGNPDFADLSEIADSILEFNPYK
jgi:hypothetical protein